MFYLIVCQASSSRIDRAYQMMLRYPEQSTLVFYSYQQYCVSTSQGPRLNIDVCHHKSRKEWQELNDMIQVQQRI